jgi:hypothetical protein
MNEADPVPDNPEITASSVNEDRTVYLISEGDGETEKTVERWLKRNHKAMFEEELEGWYADPSLWPKERTWKVFWQWFEVEHHTDLPPLMCPHPELGCGC